MNTRTPSCSALVLAAGVLLSGTAAAALLDRGNGLIYDDVLDITWLQNASQGAGSVFDDGSSTTDGLMTWQSAVSWAESLVYQGFDDWRLPVTAQPDPTCAVQTSFPGFPDQGNGLGCTGSEMGHLFNVDGISKDAPGPFTNIPTPHGHWSGTEFAPAPISAWAFSFTSGGQGAFEKDVFGAAWAVRDGDVSAGPPNGTAGPPPTSFTSDPPSPQPVGTKMNWSTVVESTEPLRYRFSVKYQSEPTRIVRDFGVASSFEWSPMRDGFYTVSVDILNDATSERWAVSERVLATSRAQAGPVVTPTEHPLVVLYSAPPCPQAQNMRVHFVPTEGFPLRYSTDQRPCDGLHSMNFLIGGMRASSSYTVQHELRDAAGSVMSLGPELIASTGAIPPGVDLPVTSPISGPFPGFSITEPLALVSAIGGMGAIPFAVDITGSVVWYSALKGDLVTSLGGGRFLQVENETLKEVDLRNQIVQQTNNDRVSRQLEAKGLTPTLGFHHDAIRLPNGYTAVLMYAVRRLTDVQGPGPVDVLGDYIVILDKNFQVVWVWDSFAKLDPNRTAILGEVCSPGVAACPDRLASDANDWTHSNGLAYSPFDGNLLVSIRHLDWIVKIDARDGTGTGDVIWRLGPDGDFAIDSEVASPWFSHMNDPSLLLDGRLLLYDNGNTRCQGVANCFSRGQVYQLDESSMLASLDVNIDLRNFSRAVGSAQLLWNGNFVFHSESQGLPNFFATVDEFSATGNALLSLRVESAVYRAFRLPSLYAARTLVTLP